MRRQEVSYKGVCCVGLDSVDHLSPCVLRRAWQQRRTFLNLCSVTVDEHCAVLHAKSNGRRKNAPAGSE